MTTVIGFLLIHLQAIQNRRQLLQTIPLVPPLSQPPKYGNQNLNNTMTKSPGSSMYPKSVQKVDLSRQSTAQILDMQRGRGQLDQLLKTMRPTML